MRISFKSFLLLLALTITSVTFSYCTKDIYKIVENYFGKEEKVIIANPNKFKIFIDASMSMKGFVNKSDFTNLISKLVTSFRNTNDVEYYFFDTTLNKMNDYLNLFSPSIYTGYKANFDKLFKNLDDTFQKDPNSLYILITDFQFNNFNIYYNTLNSFQNILLNKGYIKFFASMFNFNGLIFPQFVNNAKPFNYKGSRPLYIVMIGRFKHANFIEELADNLLNDFYTITLTKKIPINSDFQAIDHTLNRINVKKNHYGIEKLPVKFTLTFETPLFNDWNRFSEKDFYISAFYYYRDSLIMKSPEIIIDSIKFDKKLKLFISSNKQIDDKINVYNIQCLPKTFPTWIGIFSTDDTNNINSQTNKTIWLKRYFEDLFRPVTDRLVLFEKTLIIEK